MFFVTLIMMHKKIQIVVVIVPPSGTREILLLKTCKARDSFWQNITGSVEKNEDFFSAAKRELFEEIGLHSDDLVSLNHQMVFTSRYGEVIESCFALYLKERPMITLSGEHQDFKFVSEKELAESNYRYPSNFDIALMALQKGESE